MRKFTKYPSNYVKASTSSKFRLFNDIVGRSSEDFNSGTPICRYDDGVRSISIVVNGEDEYDEDDELISNNWYEIVYWVDGEEVASDVADVDGMSSQELEKYCIREMNNFQD